MAVGFPLVLFCLVACLAASLLLLSALAGATSSEIHQGSSWSSDSEARTVPSPRETPKGALDVVPAARNGRPPNSDLFFTLSDGRVCALDPSTGVTKWTSRLGTSLFQSSSSSDTTPPSKHPPQDSTDDPDLDYDDTSAGQGEEAGAEEGGENADVSTDSRSLIRPGRKPGRHGGVEGASAGRLIPGADGMLYEYNAELGLQELSYSVRDLVDSSPSITGNGEMIVGSRSSTVVLMDVANGRVIHSFNTSAQEMGPESLSVHESFLPRCVRRLQQARAHHGDQGDQGVQGNEGEGTQGSAEEGEMGQGEGDDSDKDTSERERLECQRIWESALFFVRTDYVLKSFELATGTLKWNVSYGEVSSLHDTNRLDRFGRMKPGRGPDAIFGTPPGDTAAAGVESLSLVPLDDYGDIRSLTTQQQHLSGQHSKGTLPAGVNGADGPPLRQAPAQHHLSTVKGGGSGVGPLRLVTGEDACNTGNTVQGAAQYCVQMRDPQTGTVKWTASLPAVPISAFSASGQKVQNFVGTPGRTETLASVLFLPQADQHFGSAFVLPQPAPMKMLAPGEELVGVPTSGGRAGKFTVPAVIAGPGGALVPVEARHGKGPVFGGIACEASHQSAGASNSRFQHTGAGSSMAPSRFHPGQVAPALEPEVCGDACAIPPKPAPEPSGLSLLGLSSTVLFSAALAVLLGLVSLFSLSQWRGQRRGVPLTLEEWEKEGSLKKERHRGKGKGRGEEVGKDTLGHRRRKRGHPHTPVKSKNHTNGEHQVRSEGGSPAFKPQGTPEKEGSPALAGIPPEEKAMQGSPLGNATTGEATVRRSPPVGAMSREEGGSRGTSGWGRWERDEVAGVGCDALRVGRLLVGSTVIGYGSHGTVVLEGELEGRPVAVKRMLLQFYEKARKEISALIATDEHPNVVRCFAMEEDGAFVYMALERCTMSLADLITACGRRGAPAVDDAAGDGVVPTSGSSDSAPECYVAAASSLAAQGLRLWDENGFPTPTLTGLLRDIVSGLSHLHSQRIVHRDLKPQNVLVQVQRQHACGKGRKGAGEEHGLCVCATRVRAKLSDMGISKRLADEASSFDQHTAGSGSSGWQAPEQLLDGQRQTRSVDMFPLGSLLFYCVSAGRHPFGGRYERDANVLGGKFDLFPVQHVPEAEHLIGLLLSKDPEKRPSAAEVSSHPLMWPAGLRLSFLKDASDRVEREDRVEGGSVLLDDLEATAQSALGAGQWRDRIDGALLGNLGMYRRYNYRSVRDLLRVIRNKCNHYRELPEDVQALFGTMPEGFEHYFRQRFPRLLIEVYLVLIRHCYDDHVFAKYFIPSPSHT